MNDGDLGDRGLNRIDPKLQLILFLALFFALWAIRATVLIRFDESIQTAETRAVFAALVKFLLWFFPAMAFVKWVRRRNPSQYLGVSVLPGLGMWVGSLLAIGFFCALILSFEILVGQKNFSLENLPATGLGAGIAFFIVSPWVEEVFFRGLVLHELSAFMKAGYSNLVASCLFVLIHLPYWIYAGSRPQEIAANSVGVFLFSLFAGWLFYRSKSVWPSTAAHIANNILSSLLSGR